jgi:TetR/AcrR family tetracycline transcriptional repressor
MRLKRETIVHQTLALVNEIGLDALTVRRLAEQLHVQNPALYRHFTSKQELLDSMAEMMLHKAFEISEAPIPEDAWDRQLAHLARTFRHLLLSQRDGARIIASANLPKPTLLHGYDRMLSSLQKAGFSQASSFIAIKTLFDYALGSAFEEQADPQRAEDRLATIEQIHTVQPLPALMKTLEELGRENQEKARESSFEAGISIIIMGLRAAHTLSNSSSF